MHDREAEAGIHSASVDVHRARAALAVVATLLCSGKLQIFAQRIEQSDTRFQQHAIVPSIDIEDESHRAGSLRFRNEFNDRGRRGNPVRRMNQRRRRSRDSRGAQLGQKGATAEFIGLAAIAIVIVGRIL